MRDVGLLENVPSSCIALPKRGGMGAEPACGRSPQKTEALATVHKHSRPVLFRPVLPRVGSPPAHFAINVAPRHFSVTENESSGI